MPHREIRWSDVPCREGPPTTHRTRRTGFRSPFQRHGPSPNGDGGGVQAPASMDVQRRTDDGGWVSVAGQQKSGVTEVRATGN